MTITYSTNWMGPISMDWFRERGLVREVEKAFESADIAEAFGMDVGEKYIVDEISTYYSAGRIDIRGVPDEPYGLEYGLAPMHGEDWNALSDFLNNFTSETLVSYEQLIELFETNYGKKIRWADA